MRPMVCTCSYEGTRDVEEVRLHAMQRLGLDRMGDLMTAVILSLAFDFGAKARIDVDQWFGVEVTAPGQEPMWIECDHPADGLLYLWTELADKGIISRQRPISLGYGIALENSQHHLADMAKIREERRAHYGSHEGKYKDDCAGCRGFIDRGVANRIAMDHAWGTEVVEQCIVEDA